MPTVHRRAISHRQRVTAQTGEGPSGSPRLKPIPAATSLGRSLLKRGRNSKAEDNNWSTFPTKRRVVIAVHTVAAAMRLKDVVPVLDEDPEIGLIFTAVPDRLGDGVEELLQKWEVKRLA